MHSFHKVSRFEKLTNKAFRYIRTVCSPKPLVDFFVAGTAKGGTTALHFFLEQHPEICMPYTTKELHFFDNDRYFLNLHSIVPPYKKYHSNYKPTSQTKIFGEACPSYMWNEKAPERIYEYNPSSKIIILLRNPIHRAYSHWNMASSKSNDKASFSDALSLEIERTRVLSPKRKLEKFISYQQKTFSHIDRGYYSSQIRRLFRFFPKNHISVFLSEDLKDNHNETLSNIFNFLEVDSTFKVERENIHKREYKSSLSAEDLEKLKIIFTPEIKSLELLLDRSLEHWLSV